MTQKNWMKFLEIHSANDGRKIFNAATRYDFYLIQRVPPKKTVVVDQLGGEQQLDLT